MPDILIRDLPAEVVESLKARAERSKRSLQQELRLALERLAEETTIDPAKLAERIRERLEGKYGGFEDSTKAIRKDRAR